MAVTAWACATPPEPDVADPTEDATTPAELPCPVPTTFYPDEDGDGIGVLTGAITACELPGTGSWSTEAGDCNDGNIAVLPGATEICDGLDNDCDGPVDDADTDVEVSGGVIHYADSDLDGVGAQATQEESCALPAGRVTNAGDCDDGDDRIHPGADEWCDGIDGDCDGAVDEDAVDANPWFSDLDGDGYGDPAAPLPAACTAPPGAVPTGTDCDDARGLVSPGALETCDGLDNDCDGSIDEDATDAIPWFADLDGDGVGAGIALFACAQPSGYANAGGDCDESAPDVFPGAAEFCNNRDDDCDGAVDESAVDTTLWYLDSDGDGYGNALGALASCSIVSGRVTDAAGLDCDDGDPTVHPGAIEDCGGVDMDCDGDPDGPNPNDGATWYPDVDSDGFGDDDAAESFCAPPAGYLPTGGDCDDFDADSYPGAIEVCDGADNDCNTVVDDGAIDGMPWYTDGDGDGVGGGLPTLSCGPQTGQVALDGDCDDADASVHPGATEWCDGVDSDCDGLEATNQVTHFPSVGLPTNHAQPGGLWVFGGDGALVYCDGDYYGGLQLLSPAGLTISSVNGPSVTSIHLDGQDGIAQVADDGSPGRQPHTLTLDGFTIYDADDSLGAIRSDHGDLVIANCVIRAPIGGFDGDIGAVLGTTEVRDTTITDMAPRYAALGTLEGAGLIVDNSVFERISGEGLKTEGTAPITVSNTSLVDLTGLAVTLYDGDLTMTDVDVFGAEVGAVRLERGDADITGLNVVGSALVGGDVGGVEKYGVGTATIRDSFFQYNGEDQITCVLGGTLNVYDTVSSNNLGAALVANLCTVDIDGLSSTDDDLGVFVTEGTVTVRNTVVDAPYYSAMGFTYVDLVMEDTTIRNQGSRYLDNGYVMSVSYGNAQLTRVTLEDNATDDWQSGGGMWIYESTAVLTDPVFRNNSVTDYGVLYVYMAAAELINPIFEDNIGGAVEVDRSALSCVGTPGQFAGFHRNDKGITVTGTNASVTATDCDFGELVGGDDNTLWDLYYEGASHAYGDDATFVCAGEVCL